MKMSDESFTKVVDFANHVVTQQSVICKEIVHQLDGPERQSLDTFFRMEGPEIAELKALAWELDPAEEATRKMPLTPKTKKQ